MTTKVCSKCKVEKDVGEFGKYKVKGMHGVRGDCRECVKAYQKEYHKANAEKIRVQQKEYNKANAEKIRVQRKEYRKANAEKRKVYWEANAEKFKAGMRTWHKANAENVAARKRARRQADLEAVRMLARASYKANRETILARGKIYRERNLETLRRKNMMRMRESVDSLSDLYMKQLLRESGTTNPPQEMVELKREIIAMKRERKTKRRALKQITELINKKESKNDE